MSSALLKVEIFFIIFYIKKIFFIIFLSIRFDQILKYLAKPNIQL